MKNWLKRVALVATLAFGLVAVAGAPAEAYTTGDKALVIYPYQGGCAKMWTWIHVWDGAIGGNVDGRVKYVQNSTCSNVTKVNFINEILWRNRWANHQYQGWEYQEDNASLPDVRNVGADDTITANLTTGDDAFCNGSLTVAGTKYHVELVFQLYRSDGWSDVFHINSNDWDIDTC